MVKRRSSHGLVVTHLQDKPSLLAIGGYDSMTKENIDSIEKWTPYTGWTMTNMKLTDAKSSFGYASLVPTGLICTDVKNGFKNKISRFDFKFKSSARQPIYQLSPNLTKAWN